MDKNTITGLLLIAAIMFGFFYLTKPKTTETDSAAAVTAVESTGATEPERFATVDSLHLRQALLTMGRPNADGKLHYSADGISLTAAGNGTIDGFVAAGNDTVDVASILAGNASAAASRKLAQFVDNSLRYQGLARHLGGENREITLSNELVDVTVSTLGGIVSQVTLKKYNTEVGEEPRPVTLFTPGTDGYSFSFTTDDQRIDTREFNFSVATQEGDSAVTLRLEPASGACWDIRYALRADSYVVDMTISQSGMDNFLPANTSSMDFAWHQKMARNEKGRTFEERNSAIYYKYCGESPDDLNSGKNTHKELNGRVRWVAFKNQFFSSVIVSRDAFNYAHLNSTILKDSPDYLKDMTMTAAVPYTPADGVAGRYSFYFGPNDYSLLRSLDKTLDAGEDLDLTRLIPLGWGIFRWINTLIVIPVFNWLSPIGNYGIIILLLTLFIKLIIFPFTFKSFQSQAKMRALAPEIKKINEKYPDQADAMKRSQETMSLYSKAGASPFSGCLPMLLQMPVLIAMFSFFPSAIELRGQSFLWAHDLSAPDSILTLPFTIPFYGNHVSLFCLLMTAVNIIYMKISMSSQPGGASMPGMKFMQYMMPVMFLFIFNDYASGLSYYYFLSLLITIVQSWAFRHFTDEDKLRRQMAENAKKPRKKSGFMARLEEASRQAQAAQREQARRRR